MDLCCIVMHYFYKYRFFHANFNGLQNKDWHVNTNTTPMIKKILPYGWYRHIKNYVPYFGPYYI